MKATIREIAERVGVSSASVSLVLNHRDCRISEETRQKIFDTAREIGYVRKKDRIKSKSRYSGRLIALIYPRLRNELIEECMQGIEEYASLYDYHVFQLYCSETTQKCIEQIELAVFLGADGLILIPPNDMNTGDNHVLLGEALKHSGIQYLLLDKAVYKVFCDFITADNKLGVGMAMDHLLSYGHRRIGILAGKKEIYNTRKRVEGYRDSLALNGLEYEEELVCYGEYSRQSGYEGAGYLLSKGVTGIVSCNGEVSLGVYEYARENRKVIGEDSSIVSFGNLREAGWVNPMLTSIIQPGEQMGRKAVEVLISRIQHEEIGGIHTNYFTPTLRQGESVKRMENAYQL